MARAPYSPKLRTQPARWLALVSAIVCESATMDEPSNGGNVALCARIGYHTGSLPPPLGMGAPHRILRLVVGAHLARSGS